MQWPAQDVSGCLRVGANANAFSKTLITSFGFSKHMQMQTLLNFYAQMTNFNYLLHLDFVNTCWA
jgi:hypothetical protein